MLEEPAHHMHENIEAAETLTDGLRHEGAPFGGRDIRRDELVSMGKMAGLRPCGGEHGGTGVP